MIKKHLITLVFSAAVLMCASALTHAAAAPPQPAAASAPAVAADPDVAHLIAEVGLRESAEPVSKRAGWRVPRTVIVRRFRPDIAEWLQPVVPGAKLIVVDTPAQALAAAKDAEVILGFCFKPLIAAAPSLRWVLSAAAGVEDCVDAPAVKSGQVMLTNSQRIFGPVMSEYVVAMLYSLSRAVPQMIAQQRDGKWDQRFAEQGQVRSLRGKTLLVVGLGGIGTEIARAANNMGMKVIATRNSSREAPPFVSYVGLSSELLTLAAQADAIVNVTPLTPATTNIFDASFFKAMKPSAYFINVGRGASVVTADLDAALRSGQIAGAAIDVTEPEPLPSDNPLWHAPNLIISPHVSNASQSSDSSRMLLLRENLRRYVAGERMLSVVDPQRGY